MGGQDVCAIGTADHGPSTKTAAQSAGDVLEPEQEQSDVLQKRELRQISEYIRIGIQQRVLAVVADVQRVVSPLQRLLRRAKAE